MCKERREPTSEQKEAVEKTQLSEKELEQVAGGFEAVEHVSLGPPIGDIIKGESKDSKHQDSL